MQQQKRTSAVYDLACLLLQPLCSAISFLLPGTSVGAASPRLVMAVTGHPWVNDPL